MMDTSQINPAIKLDVDFPAKIESLGAELGTLVADMKHSAGLDQRWVSVGATDLQKGLMALSRAVLQPTKF